MEADPNVLWRLESLVAQLEVAMRPEPEFVTAARAAAILGLGVKALRSAIQRGEVRVYHLGTSKRGRRRVHLPEVRTWALGTAFDPFEQARAAGDAAARSKKETT